MRKMLVILMVAAAICLQGCDKNVVYAEERDVDETGWNMDKPVVFDVNIQDTLQVYDFFIDVRRAPGKSGGVCGCRSGGAPGGTVSV